MAPQRLDGRVTGYQHPSRRLAAATPLLGEGFVVTSPQDDRTDTVGVPGTLPPTADRVSSHEILCLVAIGDGGVFVVYEYERATGSRSRNAEFIRVRDTKIVATPVFFGASARPRYVGDGTDRHMRRGPYCGTQSRMGKSSGGRRIRTSVGVADDFTDRSLWPLGHPPKGKPRKASRRGCGPTTVNVAMWMIGLGNPAICPSARTPRRSGRRARRCVRVGAERRVGRVALGARLEVEAVSDPVMGLDVGVLGERLGQLLADLADKHVD